jgi:hypothetical protein
VGDRLGHARPHRARQPGPAVRARPTPPARPPVRARAAAVATPTPSAPAPPRSTPARRTARPLHHRRGQRGQGGQGLGDRCRGRRCGVGRCSRGCPARRVEAHCTLLSPSPTSPASARPGSGDGGRTSMSTGTPDPDVGKGCGGDGIGTHPVTVNRGRGHPGSAAERGRSWSRMDARTPALPTNPGRGTSTPVPVEAVPGPPVAASHGDGTSGGSRAAWSRSAPGTWSPGQPTCGHRAVIDIDRVTWVVAQRSDGPAQLTRRLVSGYPWTPHRSGPGEPHGRPGDNPLYHQVVGAGRYRPDP